MNQLLQKAFERAAELPQAEQDRFAASCWLNWSRSDDGLSCLTVPSLRICWNA